MLQGGGIDPRAQPRETLRQYGSFHADPRDPDELLELVGLSAVARTRYRRLSGGERQRLGLALALVGRPEVVILDEPTAGMDPEARATTRAIVADLRADGAAILMTSHDLTDVERLADRIYVLVAGRIVAAGTPAELRAGVTARLRFRLDRALGTDEVAALERALGAIRPGLTVRPDGDGGRYRLEGRRAGRRGRRGLGRLVRHSRAAHRRAPDLRWQPRGRLPRARRGQRRTGRGRAVSRPAPLAAATLAQTGMELRLTARRGENVLVTIVIPVVVLLFFASVAILPTGSGVPVDFLLPGTLALAVIAASLVNLGIATAYERNYGVLKRLGGSPLTRAGLLDGQDAGRPRGGDRAGRPARRDRGRGPRLASGAGCVAGRSSSLPFSSARSRSAGSDCSSRVRSGPRRPWPSPTACSSRSCCSAGSSIPVAELPEPLATLAGLLPAAALADAFRVALGSGEADAGRALATLAVWGVGAVVLALRTFRWE